MRTLSLVSSVEEVWAGFAEAGCDMVGNFNKDAKMRMRRMGLGIHIQWAQYVIRHMVLKNKCQPNGKNSMESQRASLEADNGS